MLKLESKDSLLVRIWYSDRAYPLSHAYYELAFYGHVHGSVLLGFCCSGFALMLFCRCILSLPPGVSYFLGRHL
jgi:hypothetical protein